MAKIKSLGFNTIRVFISPVNNNGILEIPTGSYTSYFSIVDQFLDSVNAHNLKAILVVGPEKAWEVHESFKSYLETISTHFYNNTTILAYDLYNEPFNTFKHEGINDKFKISNWVSEWCYVIKEFDKNHLITIGLTHPQTSIAWDPLVMPIDFVSFHFYAWTEDLQNSKDRISSYIYWASKTIQMPWIIGEIGYSGTNIIIDDPQAMTGSEYEQADFATYTMQKSLDCNCLGYSWWQYQDVNWVSPWEIYLGLVNFYGDDGFDDETNKQVANVFNQFWTMSANSSNCTKPLNYYNIYNLGTVELTGRVIDNNGLPVENAVIVGWKEIPNSLPPPSDFCYPYYTTFSNVNGYFTLRSNTPGYNINVLWVSLPGYSTVKVNSPLSYAQYKIIPINYNKWTKKWSNNESNKIDGWTIHDYDKFYFGDFNGDGKDEILCVSYTGGNNDWMTMLYFDNTVADWEWGWSNYGNSTLGNGIYDYRKNLIVGDFNGDGRDDLLGIDINGNWITTFTFGTDEEWHWWQSNYGYVNNRKYPMSYLQPYTDYIVTGDFDGDGRDDLLGSDLPNGWTTWFKFTTANQWAWQQSDNGYTNNSSYPMSYMRPYRDQYIVGDFDGDGRDEILGNDLPNAYMTLFGFENGNWQWIWSDNGNDIVGMRPYRNNLIVGNFDNDGKDELLGFSTWATKFDFESGNFVWDWSTGSSGIFSDWSVLSFQNKYTFTKTYKYSPEQLIAINSNFGLNYTVNMYSFNNDNFCSIIKKTNIFKSISTYDTINYEAKLINPELNIYPNPTTGKVFISCKSCINSSTLISVINIKGEVVSTTCIDNNSADKIIELNLENLSEGMYFIKVINDKFISTEKIIYLKN